MKDLVELVGGVGLVHAGEFLGGRVQGVAVERQHVRRGHVVCRRVEVGQVAEDEAAGVADAAVGLDQAGEDLVGDADVVAVVHGRRPQAQDFRAVLVDDLLRLHAVAERFRHLAALAVHHVAVGENLAVGRDAARAEGGQQRTVEPAPVLVRALEVHVGGEGQLRALFEHGGEARARVEPDVENVRFLAPVRAAAGRAGEPGGHEVGQVRLEPIVAAALVAGELLRHGAHPGGVVVGRVAGFADEREDGHAPGALARDAPVRAAGDHVVDALLAPSRNPLHVVFDGGQGAAAQVVFFHGNKPLGRGPEDDRLLAAPAVGIGVADLALGEQMADFLELFDDLGVGLPDGEPGEIGHDVEETTGVVHGRKDVEAVAQARVVVLAAVSGRGMHEARAGVEGHVVGGDEGRRPVVEGVARGKAFQGRALGFGQDRGVGPAEEFAHALEQLPGQHVLAVARGDEGVVELGMRGHGHVVRQGPGRGRPDDGVGPGRVGHGENFLEFRVGQGEAHENRGRGLVGVFHLGLGQGGFAGQAPVDGLLAAVDRALFHEIAQRQGRGRLVGRAHGEVGVVPVAEDAQALEFLALDVHELGGVVPAQAAYRDRGQVLLALDLELLGHLVLDGEPMAVPARDVGGLPARHVARLDDDILEDFVERMPHVQVAVGVGRAVVEHIAHGVLAGGEHLAVHVVFGPEFEGFRFLFPEVGLHGKGGLGQLQGLLIIGAHGGRVLGLCARASRRAMPEKPPV